MPQQLELDDAAAETIHKSLRLDKLFPRFTAGDALQVFPNSRLLSYVKDDHVIEQGDESRDLYVVVAGSVAITQTMGTMAGQLATLNAGELFGEIALFNKGERIASAVAGGGCSLYKITEADARAAMARTPDLEAHLKAIAAQRRES